jgi:hypothetical protein
MEKLEQTKCLTNKGFDLGFEVEYEMLLACIAKITNANIYNIYKQKSNSLSIIKIKRCAKYNSNAIAIL